MMKGAEFERCRWVIANFTYCDKQDIPKCLKPAESLRPGLTSPLRHFCYYDREKLLPLAL